MNKKIFKALEKYKKERQKQFDDPPPLSVGDIVK